MPPPKGWLQTCHPVALYTKNGEPFADENVKNVFNDKTYGLLGDPSRFAPYRPMKVVEGEPEWRLFFPNEEYIASQPQTREKMIPGDHVSYMITVRGKLDKTYWETLGDKHVPYGDKRQYLSRFYLYEKKDSNSLPYRFLLQMMLTPKEYTRLFPVKTKAVIAYLHELAPALELDLAHVSDEHVQYDVLSDTQFMLDGETWYSYHPLYIAPGKNTIADAFQKEGARAWSPLKHVRGKTSGFASFPRAIHSCDEDVVKPPFDPESFRAFEDAELERIVQMNRQKFYREEFAKRVIVNVTYTTNEDFMKALIKRYETKFRTKFQKNPFSLPESVLESVSMSVDPTTLALNIMRAYSTLESKTKKKISFYKLLYEYPSNPEEFAKRFAPKLPKKNVDRIQDDFIKVTANFLKLCYERARTAMARIDFDQFPYRVIDTKQVLDEVENDFIITSGVENNKNIVITIELDLTSLLDSAAPVYIPNLQRLRSKLRPEQTAKGQAEKARKEWEEVHERHPLRGAGVTPVPNPGYWMAAVRRRQEALCGGFVWT